MSPDRAVPAAPAQHRNGATRRGVLLSWVTVILVLATATAVARNSDRRQPMDIDAGRQSGTFSADSVNMLSGGVRITQGSLDISANTAKVTLANGEPTRALFSGAPVVLKQTMDDGTPLNARANNIDYDLKTEIVVFTGNVSIEQPRGSMSGQRIVYNLKTGGVESGGEGGGRVKMRILPRNQGTPAADVDGSGH